MHRAWLPLLALSASLAGCSISMTGAIPSVHGHAAQYNIVAAPSVVRAPVIAAAAAPAKQPSAALETTVIDVPALYRTVVSVPALVGSLGRDLVACTGVIAAIGLLNAILLVRLPKTISTSLDETVVTRVGASISATLGSSRIETAALSKPKPALHTTTAGRACSCGTTINVRSRTGKCRRCAQIARLEQLRVPRAISHPMLMGSATGPVDGWEQSATAVVSHARLGERRQYYTFDFSPPTERQPVFIEIFADSLVETPELPIPEYEQESALR